MNQERIEEYSKFRGKWEATECEREMQALESWEIERIRHDIIRARDRGGSLLPSELSEITERLMHMYMIEKEKSITKENEK